MSNEYGLISSFSEYRLNIKPMWQIFKGSSRAQKRTSMLVAWKKEKKMNYFLGIIALQTRLTKNVDTELRTSVAPTFNH